MQGTAKKWNDRGFTFIRPDDGGDDVFAHATAIVGGGELSYGERVEYLEEIDPKTGRMRAAGVTRIAAVRAV